MHRIQAIVLLIAAFFLFSGSPCAMAADAKPAPTAEQLQAEYGQIQVQYQLVQSQRENLAYRERDLRARAQEIQAALRALEPKKSDKADVDVSPMAQGELIWPSGALEPKKSDKADKKKP